ncbi:MAG: phosphoenolpyruvate synthase, partial [Thermoanaerobaculia bacterium]
NPEIADEIGRLNDALDKKKRDYLLIGPGRWGSADRWLGIPVQWSQISRVKVIVEASPKGYDVEPSQGTHFFQNMTSLEIGYLALPPGADHDRGDRKDFLDLAWLDARQAVQETRHLRWLHFEDPLTAVLDGRRGRAVIAKPGVSPV